MEPRSAPARATAAAGPRPPTFASQTNALLRKNLIFQVRSPTDNRIMQNLFTDSPLSNLSDHTSIFSGLLGTDIPGFTTGFIDPAFDSERSIYVLDPQCKSSDSVTVTITIGSANAQKAEIKCVQGLPLWRNSSRTINDETFQGYRKGKTAEGINEIAMVILTTTVTAAYDFQDSNEKNFKVLTLYNSTYQNVSFIPMPLGLLRISRSLNAVSNAYLQLVQGSGFKMLLDFTKEMPKQATRLTFDFSAVVGPLFFEWVVVLLFPVMLTYLVYEKQHKLRTMMKMHGLGDGPYWIIYYMCELFQDQRLQYPVCFLFSFINLQIVMAFLASSFFSKVNTAQAIAYLYIFGSGLIAGNLIRNFIEGGKFPIGQTSSPLSIIKRLLKKDRASRRITVNEIADKDVHVEMEKLDIITERETVDQVLQEQNSGYAVVCDDLKKAVDESLRSVNLLHGGAPDKQVKKYSGGMRRRLSVAISLIGDAKVVYMDEPSTGLDPASRKSLWNAVKQAKQDRAIILTTHSMEEAETLCDRLCIMVDGSLQCIGTPKELIARYGGYYVLTMTTSPEFEQEVENLVRKLSPSARKVYNLSGTQKYELLKQEARMADVFMAVESFKKRVEVQAWGLADTTMEDVFVKVAKGAQLSQELS
nr:unnamed protein product [Digitaria exilis]